MNGVTILETIELMERVVDETRLIAIVFIILFAIPIGGLISLLFNELTGEPIIGVAITIFIVIASCCFVANSSVKIEPSGEYQYRCIIDDTVSVNELIEKYRIIERSNNIYILEEIK